MRFPFATAARGKAVIQTIVVAGDATDASNVTVPVYEPATTESFATYGVVDRADAPGYEQLKVPADLFADVGGFETEVSSTQLQALTDAFGYLNAYPYECAEQRSSRMLGTAAMHDVLDAFAAPGRPTAHYRIGITYAPSRVDLPALDAGFVVRRSYEPIDHTSDVTTTATGVRIKLGARVQVIDEVIVTTRRDGVALVDPLPAGLEAVNTSLATAERGAGDDKRSWDHVEMRDSRSEAFASTLNAGAYRFAFTARATTPGTFTAAPAKAEEMYSPETFGRSAGTTVTVY